MRIPLQSLSCIFLLLFFMILSSEVNADAADFAEKGTEYLQENASYFSADSDVKLVKCPEGLKEIGENVFVGCGQLQEIYLPQSVENIAASAFADCSSQLILAGIPGSYAEQYARENGFYFLDCEGNRLLG